MSAVIDKKAFDRIKSYIDYAKSSNNLEILAGGKCDESVGYYVDPTIIQTKDPEDKIMKEEIFGPVLTIFVYKDKDLEKTMKLVDTTTPFALTGAIFGKDEYEPEMLRVSAFLIIGNFLQVVFEQSYGRF